MFSIAIARDFTSPSPSFNVYSTRDGASGYRIVLRTEIMDKGAACFFETAQVS